MVGIRSFPFGMACSQGRNVSFRLCTLYVECCGVISMINRDLSKNLKSHSSLFKSISAMLSDTVPVGLMKPTLVICPTGFSLKRRSIAQKVDTCSFKKSLRAYLKKASKQPSHPINTNNHQPSINHQPWTRWWFQTFIYFHPYLGKWSNLTNIFRTGWFNHHLVNHQPTTTHLANG